MSCEHQSGASQNMYAICNDSKGNGKSSLMQTNETVDNPVNVEESYTLLSSSAVIPSAATVAAPGPHSEGMIVDLTMVTDTLQQEQIALLAVDPAMSPRRIAILQPIDLAKDFAATIPHKAKRCTARPTTLRHCSGDFVRTDLLDLQGIDSGRKNRK